jgi:branched-chain amino acid transport system substrate-binding protein
MGKQKAAAAGILVLLVAASGCASSGKGSATSSSSSSSAVTGTPLKIALIGDGSGPGVPDSNLAIEEAGVNGAVKAINAAGGINGHPLQVLPCDTNLNPNGAAACARSAVSAGAVAAVATSTQFGANAIPILNAAHIAELGQIAVGAADLTNPNGFPLAPVGIDIAAGEPALAASLGATKISMVHVDLPVAAQLPQLAAIGLAPHALKLVNAVAIPQNAPDMSPYVASATEHGSDAVAIILGNPSDTTSFVRGAKQAGYQGKLVSDAASLLRVFKAGQTAAVEGLYSLDVAFPASDTSVPAVKKMDSEIDAVDSTVVKDYSVEDGWASVYLFAQVAKTLPTVTAESILAAMPTVTNFDSGVFPPIDFSKPLTAIPGLHVFNGQVLYEQVRSGQLVPVTGQFVTLLG